MALVNPYLQVESLTKRIGERVLFENVSFGIAEGQHVGLIAKNGTGKSTLLNILDGRDGYDDGRIVYRNGLKVGYLEQSPSYPSDFTVIEACFSHGNEVTNLIREYEKCMAGEPFIGGKDPKIVEMTLRTRRLLTQFNATDYADMERRQALLHDMLGSMGKGVHVDIDFHCEYGKHIFIGDKVIINMNCTFVDNNRIDIGSNVLIASNVQIYTATHSIRVNERMVQDWSEGQEICRTYALPVKIEDGVWIGGGVIILPGVTIGRNSVIGAGSVVTRSIPESCVAVGNPCRVIKQIDNGSHE